MSDSKKQIVVVKTKAPEMVAFHYTDQSDLENLINFVGKKPSIDFEKGNLVINFRKHRIVNDSLVFRNTFGDVTNVVPYSKVKEVYDVISSVSYTPVHNNKVVPKEKRNTNK